MNQETKQEEVLKYDFERDLIQGLKYEVLFKEWLSRVHSDNIKECEGYFPDYDMELNGVTYEIKRDFKTHTTGNICLEYWYNTQEGKSGWFQYSKADKLVYFITEKKFFIADMNELRHLFDKALSLFEKCEIQQKEGFTTTNFLIPLKFLRGLVWGSLE